MFITSMSMTWKKLLHFCVGKLETFYQLKLFPCLVESIQNPQTKSSASNACMNAVKKASVDVAETSTEEEIWL